MSIKAGRVGVALDQVDEFGNIKSEATTGYTKQEADAKFETQTHAASTYETKSDAAVLQPKILSVPIEMLSGTKLTVESSLQGLNSDKQNKGVWTASQLIDLTETDLAGLGTLKWSENVETHEAILAWIGNGTSPASDVQGLFDTPFTEQPIIEASALIQNGRYMNIQSQKLAVRLSSGKNWSLGYLLFATAPR